MNPRLSAFTAEYVRQRALLMQAHPELADDPDMLRDTLDGISHAQDIVADICRKAREDRAMARALAGMMDEMRVRKNRLEARADKQRDMGLSLLESMGETKVERPDITISVARVPPKVEIMDETLLPDKCVNIVTTRTPDKLAIKALLEAGTEVPGATLGNGGMTIRISTK